MFKKKTPVIFKNKFMEIAKLLCINYFRFLFQLLGSLDGKSMSPKLHSSGAFMKGEFLSNFSVKHARSKAKERVTT